MLVRQVSDEFKEISRKKAEIARNKELEILNSNIKNAADYLFQLSLQCKKCNSYAVPVLGTEANYVCLKCDNRFEGSKHRLGQSMFREKYHREDSTVYTSEYNYDFRYYDSAVEYLKEQYNYYG